MALSKQWRTGFKAAAQLIIILTIWVLFAPLQVGGNNAYVIVAGDSMTPNYLFGDLVITRSQAHYRIGDAVTYRHPEIGFVFHRIIAINPDGTFLLKGDHNDWTDAHTPTQEDIVGKLWMHVPKAGNFLNSLRTPIGFAILVLFFSLLLYISVRPQKRKRNIMSNSSSQNLGERFFILAVFFLGAIALGIAAFRQPVQSTVSTPLGYEEQALFRYTANVPDGIYDSTKITPGEPIFRRLNGSFVIDMDYVFISTYDKEISGSYRLLARVSDGSGWKRTIELTPASEFSGNVFTTSGTLVLDNIQAFINTLETETGVQRGRYSLSIISEITTEGTLGGQPLLSTFSPELTFDINELEVVLKGDSNKVLNQSQSGMLMRTDYVTNTLSIFGLKLPVLTARGIALVVGLVSLFLLGAQLFSLYRVSEKDELARLKLWYGSRLIETHDANLLTRPNTVEIATLEGLANLAEVDQRTILYLPNDGRQHLFVQTPEQLYHYEINTLLESMAPALDAPRPKRFSLPSWLTAPRQKNLEAAYEHALKGWADAVDKRLSMEGQSQRIAEMAYQLANELGIRGKELEDIRMAAYLHKIGMMDVPGEIVEKKNKLSKKELEILRNHPSHARQNLDQTELLKPIAEAIYYQHERWDGSGQPEGLAGEEIPIGARIIAIVNTWNGLSQKRSYRDAWEQKKICGYFAKQSGKQFDPNIVNTFLTKIIEVDHEIYEQETVAATVVSEEEN